MPKPVTEATVTARTVSGEALAVAQLRTILDMLDRLETDII